MTILHYEKERADMRTKTLVTLNPFIVHVLIPRMWSVPVAALLFFGAYRSPAPS